MSNPPQVPISLGMAAADAASWIAGAMESAGIRVVQTGPIPVETPGGPVEVALVVEEAGRRHPVLVASLPVAGGSEQELLQRVLFLRATSDFSRSRVIVYSSHPLPETLRHYADDGPVSLFETTAAAQANPGPDAGAGARVCRELAAAFLDVQLDGSPESLARLDRVAARFRIDEDPQYLAPTVFVLGAYLGEVVVRHLGGSWDSGLRRPFMENRIRMEGGRFVVWPYRKTMRVLQAAGRDPEQSFVLYYERLEAKVAARSGGSGGRTTV